MHENGELGWREAQRTCSGGADMARFTGPKITLDVADLTPEQEQAIREEGLGRRN